MSEIVRESLTGLRVLVTDGEQRAALAIVRSLGAAGAHVIVGSVSGKSLAGASRHCRGELRLPGPLATPSAFVRAVGTAVKKEKIALLMPVTEAALRPILADPTIVAAVRLPFPTSAMFARASDKLGLVELAAGLGVPVPRQVVLATRGDGNLADIDLPVFPLILKPAVSVAGDAAGQTKLAVRHVDGAEAFRIALDELPDQAFPLLVQERIVGPGIGLFLLRWEGRIIARFAHRRLREKPPAGGVSVYRESIEPPPNVVEYAERLLRELDWTGVAMVEFKRDAGSGVPYLMEINGRFWGSLQLAVDSGVDFPCLLAEAALGSVPVRPMEGVSGVRLRWLLGDLDHLLLRLRRSRAELNLEPETPGRMAALLSFVRIRRADRLEVLRISDLRPFLRELLDWTISLLRSRSEESENSGHS